MKILMTAFEPFGGETVNPSLEALNKMKCKINGAAIIKLTVPTVFHKSIDTVYEVMCREKPNVVICLGQAGGRYEITPERIAINLDDAGITDNEGNQPKEETIFQDGNTAYFSNLPVAAMVNNMKEGGIPSSISNTAGTFVCNHLMYGVLYHINKHLPYMRGGFIHVPYIPKQVINRTDKAPSMSLDDIVKGLELAVLTIIKN